MALPCLCCTGESTCVPCFGLGIDSIWDRSSLHLGTRWSAKALLLDHFVNFASQDMWMAEVMPSCQSPEDFAALAISVSSVFVKLPDITRFERSLTSPHPCSSGSAPGSLLYGRPWRCSLNIMSHCKKESSPVVWQYRNHAAYVRAGNVLGNHQNDVMLNVRHCEVPIYELQYKLLLPP